MNTRAARFRPELAASLSRRGRDGLARSTALARKLPDLMSSTSLVGYQSRGRLLIVGPGSTVRQVAENIRVELTVTLLITDNPRVDPEPASTPHSIHAGVAQIRGYLGNFHVDILRDGERQPLAPVIFGANQFFDLILDLSSTPHIRSEVLPPGYLAPGGRDGARIQEALDSLLELVGEFDKPRYIHYNPELCAHGASGRSGCRRCLDVCPGNAITSVGEHIEIDSYLCQGGGSCASTCPSGAIRYAYPALPDLLARQRALLDEYVRAGGEAPWVLLHDAESGLEWVLERAGELPENCLPFSLEEIAAAGLECWLSLLAFGASGVALLCHEQTPATAKVLLEEQIDLAGTLLMGMGYAANRIVLLDNTDASACLAGLQGFGAVLVKTPARYRVVDEKRTTLRQALDHLYAQAPRPQPCVDLPAGAPFGEIQVDRESCTLCMSCASVCPAAAVLAGQGVPQLNFIEQNCLQCALCISACPEGSISLRPRMLYNLEERSRRRILIEDDPFYCLRCNKAFAPARTIEAVLGKLSGHWMYCGRPEQLQRLKMCDDCRVRDMFEHDGQVMDVRAHELPEQ